jgi:hypothetical protein
VNHRKEIELYSLSGSPTTDSEAWRLSKSIFSVLASDLESKNEAKQYARSVLERALYRTITRPWAPTSPRPEDNAATPDTGKVVNVSSDYSR